MLRKLLLSSMITFLILEIITSLESQAEEYVTKNNLINRFCIATLKSMVEIKYKQNFNEISNFTCECFFEKYRSGSTMKNSRIFCRNKAAEKYNL